MVNEYKVLARIGLLFVMMYMIGAGLAGGVNVWKETSAVARETKDWGLGFGAGRSPQAIPAHRSWHSMMPIMWAVQRKK